MVMAGNLIRRFNGEEELSMALADHIANLSNAAILERGVFTIALSGGPLTHILRKMTKPPYLEMVEWSKWLVFWAEEKYEKIVPHEQAPHMMPHESNYEQANKEFLSKVPIFPSQIKAMPQTYPSLVPEEYELTLRKLVRDQTVNVSVCNDCPKFDLVLLVLGSDGRISSQKPDQTGLDQGNPWACTVYGEGEEKDSVTLSATVINSSDNVAVIVTGEATRLMNSVQSTSTTSSSWSAVNYTAPFSFLTKEEVVWFMNARPWLRSEYSFPPFKSQCRFE